MPDLSAAIRTAPTRVPSLQAFSKGWSSLYMAIVSKDVDYKPITNPCQPFWTAGAFPRVSLGKSVRTRVCRY